MRDRSTLLRVTKTPARAATTQARGHETHRNHCIDYREVSDPAKGLLLTGPPTHRASSSDDTMSLHRRLPSRTFATTPARECRTAGHPTARSAERHSSSMPPKQRSSGAQATTITRRGWRAARIAPAWDWDTHLRGPSVLATHRLPLSHTPNAWSSSRHRRRKLRDA